MMTAAQETFTEKWDRFLQGLTDADRAFIHSAGLFLVSTFARRALLVTPSALGGKFLNLWFICFGRTRITRKTTVISWIEHVIKKVAPAILLPEEFTPEAFITEASQVYIKDPNRTTHLAWVFDEVLAAFQRLKKGDRSYMTGIDSTFSRIYDGKEFHRRTEKRGREEIENPYFTMFVASTESIVRTFSEVSFEQGFLNRPIYVQIKTGEWQRERLDHRTDVEELLLAECMAWLKALVEMEFPIVLRIDPKARQIVDDYDKEISGLIAGESLGVKEGYMGNLPNLLQKIAGVYRVNRLEYEVQQQTTLAGGLQCSVKFAGGVRIAQIEEEDVVKAKEYINSVVMKGLDGVLLFLSRQAIAPKEVASKERLYDLVISTLKTATFEGKTQTYEHAMTQKDLFKALSIGWKDYVDLLADMVTREEIVKHDSVETKTVGRRPNVIQLVEKQ